MGIFAAAAAASAQKMPHNRTVHSRLVVAGQLLPDYTTVGVVFTREKAWEIFYFLIETVDIMDVIVLAMFAWCTVPFARAMHKLLHTKEPVVAVQSGVENGTKPVDPFKLTYTYIIAENISQVAKIAILVFLVDCAMIVLYSADINLPIKEDDLGAKIAKILYQIWFAFRCMQVKRIWVGRVARKAPEKLGRVEISDRILDFLIYAVLGFSILDTLQIEFGAGLKSLFAFGGVGTLVFSLASKDVATLFVSGLALSTSERFRVGDQVSLGDGTCGIVSKMGILYTEIRGFDEIVMKIPNSQLANQRVSNVSRMDKCQVKQVLRIHSKNIPKLEQLRQDIKEEIKAVCPELITDGTKPFRVLWTDINEDATLNISVDTRFNLPPTGDVYWNNKQNVLEAIMRALSKNGVQLTAPAHRIVQEKSSDDGS